MRNIFGLTFLVFALAVLPVQAGPLSVTVRGEATVNGPELTLGDVAEISGEDSVRIETLKTLRLGSAPSPGHRLQMTAEMVSGRLAATGADLSDIAWQMPPLIAITAAAQTISGDSLAAKAKETISRQLASRNTGLETEPVLMITPQDLLVPPGQAELRAELPSGIRFNVPTVAAVTVVVNGRPYTSVSVRFDVRAYSDVAVAARNIAAGEQITLDSLRLERREVGRLTGYIADPGQIIGQTVRRSLTAGTPFTAGQISKPVLIPRGGAVTISAKVGAMVAVAAGKALQAGREGEIIRVQNVASQKIFTARVIDGTTVQVITGDGR